jgi:PAS domain S-box-containing protein
MLHTDVPSRDFPESILRYAIRTQQSVILEDAATSTLFSSDEYVRQQRPRSVLCLPLVKQANLVGLIYLENRLTPHVFTAERIALLDLVAKQAAISLENARLYAELDVQQSRVRRLVDSSIIGIFFWNFDGGVLDANDAFLEIVGYSREEMVLGHVRWTELTPSEYEAIDADMANTLRLTGRCRPYEKEYVRKDGERVPVLIGAVSLEGGEGIAFVLDLTERKQADRAREAWRVADAANRAKSNFLAHMSHELRTPLNGILGYTQILQRETGLSERQRSRLGVIRQSGQHLLALINEILDFAKIEAGKLEFNPTIIGVESFLRVITDIVSVKAAEKGLELRCKRSPDLPEAVVGDERRLRQVLLNLLGNAVKFTNQGTVTLRARYVTPSRLRFDVEDTGVGIAEDQLESVFQPFNQFGETRRRIEGTGLGLAISRQIVRAMRGEINVASQVGVGSTFWFEVELPPAVINKAPSSSRRIVKGYDGPRRTLLVIDDVLDNRAMLTDLLRPLGFDVLEAHSGAEGLEKAKSLRPQLILTDFVMPDMNGLEATRRVRELPGHEHTPVIVVSAYASDTDEENSLAAGANAFLSKPIDVDQLLTRIGTLLRLDWIEAASDPGV